MLWVRIWRWVLRGHRRKKAIGEDCRSGSLTLDYESLSGDKWQDEMNLRQHRKSGMGKERKYGRQLQVYMGPNKCQYSLMGSFALWGICLWQLFCLVNIPFLVFKPICCITPKVNEYPSCFIFCLWKFRWMLLWNKSLQRALSKDDEQHSSVHFGKDDYLTFREVVTMSENVYKVISVMPGRKSPLGMNLSLWSCQAFSV